MTTVTEEDPFSSRPCCAVQGHAQGRADSLQCQTFRQGSLPAEPALLMRHDCTLEGAGQRQKA